MTDKDEIVAIAKLTREDVRRVGSSLKLIFKVDHAPRFESLIKALDETDRHATRQR